MSHNTLPQEEQDKLRRGYVAPNLNAQPGEAQTFYVKILGHPERGFDELSQAHEHLVTLRLLEGMDAQGNPFDPDAVDINF